MVSPTMVKDAVIKANPYQELALIYLSSPLKYEELFSEG
ncbi:hypothetical protein N39L_26670 [Limnospira platensis NIES-39]|jgi:hypothetical protein|uniref:Uncharacterized protein n=1 Tax=Limnospira platensis NIES-46 TaxID=1236695 RepID=A0A5M3T5A6_LIMPL|nr:hypothetical protein N39L_26670 [Arthrospira platensis NIES-39]GCE93041.1 hypothetical protein NIES46_10900 [Arthrospira platensis NIES-46]